VRRRTHYRRGSGGQIEWSKAMNNEASAMINIAFATIFSIMLGAYLYDFGAGFLLGFVVLNSLLALGRKP
jgi:hypothetical protein